MPWESNITQAILPIKLTNILPSNLVWKKEKTNNGGKGVEGSEWDMDGLMSTTSIGRPLYRKEGVDLDLEFLITYKRDFFFGIFNHFSSSFLIWIILCLISHIESLSSKSSPLIISLDKSSITFKDLKEIIFRDFLLVPHGR